MTLPCKIIEDLLPLYADGVCSEETRRAVESHLRECAACQSLLAQAQGNPVLTAPADSPADRAAARSFNKIRRRWFASLLMTVVLIPLCILCRNQYLGCGVHFTNLRELFIGAAFMERLQSSDFEGAYEYIDLHAKKEEWLAKWFTEETLTDIESNALAVFCESAQPLQSVGGITAWQYIGAQKAAHSYDLYYSVTIGGQSQNLTLSVTDAGVHSLHCDGSFLTDPLARFSAWSEYLWQEYAGCTFNPETGQYEQRRLP